MRGGHKKGLDHIESKFCHFRKMVTAETYSKRQCQCNVHVKSQYFQEKNLVLPIEKFLFLVPPRNSMILKHLIIQFCVII